VLLPLGSEIQPGSTYLIACEGASVVAAAPTKVHSGPTTFVDSASRLGLCLASERTERGIRRVAHDGMHVVGQDSLSNHANSCSLTGSKYRVSDDLEVHLSYSPLSGLDGAHA